MNASSTPHIVTSCVTGKYKQKKDGKSSVYVPFLIIFKLKKGVKWGIVDINHIINMEDYQMLMGKYQNSIDAKSRMIVPSKYREELGLKCILTRGIDKCLYIYPMSEWEVFMEKLQKLPTSDANARSFIRHFYANAVECEIDRQGRVTLPQDLRDYAGIEKELVTVGILNKIEIWSKSQWESAENNTELEQSDFAQKMTDYGI